MGLGPKGGGPGDGGGWRGRPTLDVTGQSPGRVRAPVVCPGREPPWPVVEPFPEGFSGVKTGLGAQSRQSSGRSLNGREGRPTRTDRGRSGARLSTQGPLPSEGPRAPKGPRDSEERGAGEGTRVEPATSITGGPGRTGGRGCTGELGPPGRRRKEGRQGSGASGVGNRMGVARGGPREGVERGVGSGHLKKINNKKIFKSTETPTGVKLQLFY